MRFIRAASAVMLVALGGCDARSLATTPTTPDAGRSIIDDTRVPSPFRKLDLLFMVDNSSSMSASQEDLRRGFSGFMEVLKALPGGMPDLHLAVISSDMGVGHDEFPGCNAAGGDRGVFHYGVGLGAHECLTTGLNPGATYIITTGGANPQNNFSGDIADVFRCIAPIGETGCGFENQLLSVARALGADGQQAPAENQGFLRPEAYLGIVLITNEDDCSAADKSFYDARDTDLASRLGPVDSFRCAEFGTLCDGARPSRRAPNGQVTDVVAYAFCEPAESGELIPVSSFVTGIKALKPDPAQVFVASIQGMAQPFEVHWKTPSIPSEPPWPTVGHSCVSPGGSFADPGIRLQRFAEQFGGNGLVYSICEQNFQPALNEIATAMTRNF